MEESIICDKLSNLAIKESHANEITMLEKLENAAPYNLFFNKVPNSPKTLDDVNTIKFTDLLCPSLGKLKSSLQISHKVNFPWLIDQYKEKELADKPLTVLYGCNNYENFDEILEKLKIKFPNVKHQHIEAVSYYGSNHSKISIYLYEDNSLRISIPSANLYREVWEYCNLQLWLSPLCPPLSDKSSDKNGESPTRFKSSLLTHLKCYNSRLLVPWIDLVRKTDFSRIKIFFVYSQPGHHNPESQYSQLEQVQKLLLRHCNNIPMRGANLWDIHVYTSSLGKYGKFPTTSWINRFLIKSLASQRFKLKSEENPKLRVVYPSFNNVVNGYLETESGYDLSYSKEVHEEQLWLNEFLHQWKADKLNRTGAMPKLKCYCRISPCLKKLAWFCMTSAGFTRSGWGTGLHPKYKTVSVRHYESGILFFPQFFAEEYFEIFELDQNKKLFPFMSDLPLIKYESDDEPWCNH